MNLFRAIPQWLAGQLSEYVDNVDFEAVRVSGGGKLKVGRFSLLLQQLVYSYGILMSYCLQEGEASRESTWRRSGDVQTVIWKMLCGVESR